jgi:adenosylcobinamide-GDP ribazoletransferase
VVGALVGACAGLVAFGADQVLTPFLAAGIAVVFEALVTGGIHLDALADCADGLGGHTRERALEIMRDGSIGAFGATALALDLLLKTGAVAELLDGWSTLPTLAAAFALGRAAPLALAWALPYARPEGGSGSVLADQAGAATLAGGLALGVALAAGLVGLRSVALVAGAVVPVLAVGWMAARRLGGVTGDVLGAALELATTGALLAAAATA